MKAIVAIQCEASTGQTGTFLFTRKENGERELQSPVFKDYYDLCHWAPRNGWNAVYDAKESTGTFVKA